MPFADQECVTDPTPSMVAKELNLRVCASIYAMQKTGVAEPVAIRRTHKAAAAAAKVFLSGRVEREFTRRTVENWWKDHKTKSRSWRDEFDDNTSDAQWLRDSMHLQARGYGWVWWVNFLETSLAPDNILKPFREIPQPENSYQ